MAPFSGWKAFLLAAEASVSLLSLHCGVPGRLWNDDDVPCD